MYNNLANNKIYIVFVDESGDTNYRRREEPFYLTTSLGVPIENVQSLRDIAKQAYQKARKMGYKLKSGDPIELKGRDLFATVGKNNIGAYIELVREISIGLRKLGGFVVSVALHKLDFHDILVKHLYGRISNAFREAGSSTNYLNTLVEDKFRSYILDRVLLREDNTIFDSIVKMQVVSDLFYRTELRLEEKRSAESIVFFDARAESIYQSALNYILLGDTTLQKGAYTKYGVKELRRIKGVFAIPSSHCSGIQLADIVSYNIYRCLKEPSTNKDLIQALEPLFKKTVRRKYIGLIPKTKNPQKLYRECIG